MQRLTACLLLLGPCALLGCSLYGPRHVRAPNRLPDDPQLSSIERAVVLQDQGEHVAATIEFRKVIESAEDDCERDEARIGAAKSLIRLHHYASAMAVLGPLSTMPEREHDCRKLALAGEILLRQHRPEEAETCLELALAGQALEEYVPRPIVGANGELNVSGPPYAPLATAGVSRAQQTARQDPPVEVIPPGTPAETLEPALSGAGPWPAGQSFAAHIPDGRGPPPSWLPGCCANLGYAYLRNDKPEKAATMYWMAATLSRQRGNHVAAERAQRTHEQLGSVLRQYAPYKPHPVSQRLPPGKK